MPKKKSLIKPQSMSSLNKEKSKPSIEVEQASDDEPIMKPAPKKQTFQPPATREIAIKPQTQKPISTALVPVQVSK